LYWITPVTLTGCPDSLVGENFAERAAPTAAPCNRGCPDTACAAITLPFSSIVTCTTTVPAACAALAIGGYAGLGKLMALPFRTPPEMGARGGVGLGASGGGGSATSTLAGAATTLPAPGPAGIGACALESLLPITVVTPRLTGGTSLALAEISFGGSRLSSTLATNSLRTSTFCSTFCGLASCGLSGSFCCCGTGTGATSVVSSSSISPRRASYQKIPATTKATIST